MKILLDECVSRKVKGLLEDFEVYTVAEMGFSGLQNGQLLNAAQEEEFDILLTIDKNIDSQQNISKFNISLVILNVFRSHISYFEALIPTFRKQSSFFEKGKVYVIE